MTLSEEFIESICDDELQKKILLVLKDPSMEDAKKIQIIVEYMRSVSK